LFDITLTYMHVQYARKCDLFLIRAPCTCMPRNKEYR
jgi:hypothetical protein